MNMYCIRVRNRFFDSRALRCGLLWLVMTTIALTQAAFGAIIAVPNGDFADSANNGSVGGGVIGGSGSSTIGSGPWHGTYAGILGLLAPPQLTIASGHATIGGLAGVDVLGILNNSGYFSQTLGVSYLPDRHYLLVADIDAGVPLELGILNDSNAGLALYNGVTIVASTTNAAAGDISLNLLTGTTYRLTLEYDTDALASGNIGVELFSRPQNLVTANLLTSVSFSNVMLNEIALNPVPASVAPASGTPQGATINTAFAAPLSVRVLDADGDPVSGTTVTFSVPGSGASATLSATTAQTDANGFAQIEATANAIAGAYQIDASVAGVGTAASFALTNLAGAASTVGPSAGTPQSATVNTAFATPLGVIVTDAGNNPVVGITVAFSAPTSGASASFPTGTTATTDSNGFAQVTAVANTVAGSYTISAQVNGATTAASFALTNAAGPAAISTPTGGTPQYAQVSTEYVTPLGVLVTDAYGNPSSGVAVTFAAPTTGASATFPPDGVSTSVITDIDGMARVTPTANATPGSYQITATFSGQTNQTVYNLTNTIGPAPQGTASSGDGQSTNINAAFDCTLQLKVTSDGSSPISGVSIDFVAPASGPSATLSDGVTSGSKVTALTDVNGLTAVTATANSIPGSYDISAGVTGSGTALAHYTLTNLGAGERIFASGFESTPALCPGG
jgi:hypothetical protein